LEREDFIRVLFPAARMMAARLVVMLDYLF
jgi:hypothetical protein